MNRENAGFPAYLAKGQEFFGKTIDFTSHSARNGAILDRRKF